MKNLMREKEMCEFMGFTRQTMNRMREGGMPYYRLGPRSIRYDRDEVMLWMGREMHQVKNDT